MDSRSSRGSERKGKGWEGGVDTVGGEGGWRSSIEVFRGSDMVGDSIGILLWVRLGYSKHDGGNEDGMS